VLNADLTARRDVFECDSDRHQHRLKPCAWHHGQYIGHRAVASRVAHERLSKLLQYRRHIQKRRPVSQRAGLALDQLDIVLPVICGLALVR
jgi:hypothetical protein